MFTKNGLSFLHKQTAVGWRQRALPERDVGVEWVTLLMTALKRHRWMNKPEVLFGSNVEKSPELVRPPCRDTFLSGPSPTIRHPQLGDAAQINEVNAGWINIPGSLLIDLRDHYFPNAWGTQHHCKNPPSTHLAHPDLDPGSWFGRA